MFDLKKDIFGKISKRKEITDLRYGLIHSQFGFSDGVSIVMQQMEDVMVKQMGVPKNNISYLLGKAGYSSKRFTVKEVLWAKTELRKRTALNYSKGFGGVLSEQLELAINEAKEEIRNFVRKNKIDIIVAHNTSHSVNFILSIALSRYYRDAILAGKKIPKYILWWHDSHLEREQFKHPSSDVENYLLQGIPGPFVDYILFINSLQFGVAKKYFKKLDKNNPGFYDKMNKNHDVVFNTTDVFIKNFKDLKSDEFNERVEKFLLDFDIRDLLRSNNLKLEDTLFCLQHTRTVYRKRIDFALSYCFEFLSLLKEKKKYKAIYFLVSGEDSSDNSRRDLIKLHGHLSKKYNTNKVFLVFASDNKKTNLIFEEYPRIFAKLGGFSTYFSEVEGFGNNLLEVLASGLLPVVYNYPVFKKDIAPYNFKLVKTSKFLVSDKLLRDSYDLIVKRKKRREWVNRNLNILKKNLPHSLIASKLTTAILSE